MLKRHCLFHKREVNQNTLSGYAFRFSETVHYMGQLERFSPDLKVDFNKQGTFLFRDHNPERVLARVPDTLQFAIKEDGLFFVARVLETALWKDTRELVKQGVLNGASVGFASEKETRDGDTLVYQRIKLYEVSLVVWPAYESSEVKARGQVIHKPKPPEIILC